MAAADLGAELLCSICRDIYRDPVTLNCGHNYCQLCIQNLLFTQDSAGVYTCPDCRTQFAIRPTVEKNATLCNITEQYCARLKIEEEMGKCPLHHQQLLEYYCFEDMARICAACCASAQHRGHQLRPLSEAAEKIRQDSRNLLEQLVSEDKIDSKVQGLQEHMREIKEKSATMKESVAVLFQDIESRLSDLRRRVLMEISNQEQQALLLTSSTIERLKVMKDDLYCKIICMEDLSNTTDDRTVLQTEFPDLSCPNVEDLHNPDIDEDLIAKTLNTGLADIVIDASRN